MRDRSPATQAVRASLSSARLLRIILVMVLLSGAALGVAACGGASEDEVAQLETRVAALETEVSQLQTRVDQLEEETAAIREIVRAIEGIDLAGLVELGDLLERARSVLPSLEDLASQVEPFQALLDAFGGTYPNSANSDCRSGPCLRYGARCR